MRGEEEDDKIMLCRDSFSFLALILFYVAESVC
jgi:hypothetical protein